MFKISTNENALSTSNGGGTSFIGKSGVYDVTLKVVSVATSKSGAQQFVFNIDYKGHSQTIYGPYFRNKDGNLNKIGVGLYTQLGVIAGLSDGDEFTVETETHKVGRDQKEVELEVVQELTDLELKLQVQAHYSKYQGKITERMNIVGFFDINGATAEELVKGANQGERLAVTLEKYADTVQYEDVTEAEVQEWIANGRGKNGSNTPKATATKPKTGGMFK